MTAQRVVSADSHVTEPADLWQTRLDRRHRDRAPKVVENPAGGAGHVFVAEGTEPFPVEASFAAGRSGEALRDFLADEGGYGLARPSGWDPVERLKDQDLDGIEAEVIYPTLGMPLFRMTDGELQRACFAAYNDWVAEYCSHAPRRLYGVGLISLEDVELAVGDLERVAEQGLRGAMIWGSPPEDRPYDARLYDNFWRAASSMQLPVSLHVITGKGRETSLLGMGHPGAWYISAIHEVQRSLSTLIFGGVLERFPELRIVSAENDTGWFPHFMYRMDHVYEKFNATWKEPLPQPPSSYVRRQIWATFQDDPTGPATHALFGEDNYMWASDFPHSDSTFPDSRRWIEKSFAAVPEDVQRKVVFANAVDLYRMELD